MDYIDLNADLGEGDDHDEELLAIVSSCNVACGGHAGDDNSMRETLLLARENDVAVGAHPSYPDREGFGRRNNFVSGDALRDSLLLQMQALVRVAESTGVVLTHVKPHGALYNDAVKDPNLAELVATAIAKELPGVPMVGLPHSEMQAAAEACGLRFVAEGFIDRAYQDNGQLVPRTEPGAVHSSLEQVLPQAVSLVGKVDTLCIHGDTPGAADVARAVRARLDDEGIEIRAFSR